VGQVWKGVGQMVSRWVFVRAWTSFQSLDLKGGSEVDEGVGVEGAAF
jgi:hypothetical protein